MLVYVHYVANRTLSNELALCIFFEWKSAGEGADVGGVGGRETSLTLRLINKINTCARRGLEPMSASVAVFLVKRNGATRYIDWHNTPPPTTRRQRCSIQPPRPNPCSSACCCYYRGVKLAATAKHAYTHTPFQNKDSRKKVQRGPYLWSICRAVVSPLSKETLYPEK